MGLGLYKLITLRNLNPYFTLKLNAMTECLSCGTIHYHTVCPNCGSSKGRYLEDEDQDILIKKETMEYNHHISSDYEERLTKVKHKVYREDYSHEKI